MAGIAPGIRAALLNDGPVSGTVGGSRIYFKTLPQVPTYPAITLELISGNPDNTLDSLPALVWSRVRVNAWGKTYQAAMTLATQVETALNGKTITVSGLVIRSVVADGMHDEYEPAVEAHYICQDYRIWHKPA